MHFQHGLIDLNAVGPVAVLVPRIGSKQYVGNLSLQGLKFQEVVHLKASKIITTRV